SPPDDNTKPETVIHLEHEHGLTTGEAVVYHNGGGTNVGGLIDGQTYYVIRVDDDHISVAASEEDALNHEEIALSQSGVKGDQHYFTRVVRNTTVTATGDIKVYAKNVTEVTAVAASLAIAERGI